MKNKDILIINGKKYDGKTGLPIVGDEKNPTAPIKQSPAKPKITKPIDKKPIKNGIMFAKKVGRTMDIARSKSIQHFSPKITAKTQKQPKFTSKKDALPSRHPLVAKVEKRRFSLGLNGAKVQSKLTTSSKAEPASKQSEKTSILKIDERPMNPSLKIFLISITSIVIIIITGFLIYSFMPSFSVKIASAQAGIKATYPEYCPDGYRLSGPVIYNGEVVTINFHANTGDSKFTIKQSKSSWDSSAVKAKAEQDASGEVMTTSEKGLTIFTYKNNATWVNGGILYSISGDAPLSSEQIRRIATSL